MCLHFLIMKLKDSICVCISSSWSWKAALVSAFPHHEAESQQWCLHFLIMKLIVLPSKFRVALFLSWSTPLSHLLASLTSFSQSAFIMGKYTQKCQTCSCQSVCNCVLFSSWYFCQQHSNYHAYDSEIIWRHDMRLLCETFGISWNTPPRLRGWLFLVVLFSQNVRKLAIFKGHSIRGCTHNT